MLILALTCTATHAQASTPRPGLAAAGRCDWAQPGRADFQGDIPAAVGAYTDIPQATRTKLQRRMALRQYDEVVLIRRDSISGQHRYAPDIWHMHWRGGLCKGLVDRSAWPAGAQERGLVYCEDGHCILVPTVCRNVSRIQRLAGVGAGPGGHAGTPAGQEPIDIAPGAGTWPAPAPPAAPSASNYTAATAAGANSINASTNAIARGSFLAALQAPDETTPADTATSQPTNRETPSTGAPPSTTPSPMPHDWPAMPAAPIAWPAPPATPWPLPPAPAAPVPEPATALLATAGLLLLACAVKCTRRRPPPSPTPATS
jgi:hypothetical protein